MTFHEKPKRLMTGHGYELLTISVRLQGLLDIPKLDPVADRVDGNGTSTYSQYVRKEAEKVDWHALTLKDQAESTLRQIGNLANEEKTRVKREQVSAPLQTLGDLLGISTGVATRPELNIIRGNFKKLTDFVRGTEAKTSTNGRAFINVLKVQEATLKLVMTQMNITSAIANDYTTTIRELQNNINVERTRQLKQATIHHRDLVHIINGWADVRTMGEFVQKITTVLEALRQLHAGSIPVTIIDHNLMQRAIKGLHQSLKQADHTLYVVQTHPAYYYNQRPAAFSLTKQVLHITVAAPIARGPALYTVYRLRHHAIPLHPTIHHPTGFTQVVGLTKYFGHAQHENYTSFIQFSSEDLAECHGHGIYECHLPMPEVARSHPTCEMALYMDMPKSIHLLCNSSVTFGKAIPSFVRPLAADTYIVSTQYPNASLKCNSIDAEMHTTVPPYSIITVPCGCNLQIGNISLSNANYSCSLNDTPPIVVGHTYNLPFIAAMGHQFDDITGSSISIKPVTVHFRDISGLLESSLRAASLLTGKAHDLKETAQRLSHLHTATLPLMKGAYDMVGDYMSRPWMILAATLVLLVNCVLTVRNTVVTTRLITLTTFFTKGHAHRMERIPGFYEELRESLTAVQNAAEDISVNHTDLHHEQIPEDPSGMSWQATTMTPIAAILVTIFTIWLLIKLFRCCRKRVCACIPDKTQPLLVLKIQLGWRVVTCPIMPVPYEGNVLGTPNYAPRLLNISPYCCGAYVSLDFDGPMELKVGNHDMTVILPTSAPVPLLDRWAVMYACRGGARPPTSLTITSSSTDIQLPFPLLRDMQHMQENAYITMDNFEHFQLQPAE